MYDSVYLAAALHHIRSLSYVAEVDKGVAIAIRH